MDFVKFSRIVKEREIRDVLWQAEKHDAQVTKNELVERLFQVKESEKVRMIALFQAIMKQNIRQDVHPNACKDLKKRVAKKIKQLPSVMQEMIRQSKPEGLKQKHEKVAEDKKTPFSSYAIPLAECKERAKLLQKKTPLAEKILEEVKATLKKDEEVRKLTRKDAEKKENQKYATSVPPYDFNRTGKGETKVFVSASNVHFDDKRSYILSACPHDKEEAAALFHAAFKKNVTLFVATLESTEAPKSRLNGFWKKKNVESLPRHYGWTLEHKTTSLLMQSKSMPDGKKAPALVETLLDLKDGEGKKKTIRHLHYEFWKDHHPAPDVDLLVKLLDEIDEHQKESATPFQINCHGGIGRTGMLAVAHSVREIIRQELAKGKELDSIEINVPEIIYQFRKKRPRILGRAEQFAQVYELTDLFYQRLKKEKKQVA
jgi:protein tyrosine phosphatase